MRFTTSKTIVGIGILAIALTIAGCPLQDDLVTPEPPPRPQAMQQSHPAESQPEPKETNEQAAAAQGTIVEVGQADFEQEVIQSDMPVVIDFWADWCGPCHMIRPTLEQLAKEFAGKLKFVSVDNDANPTLGRQFSIRHLPTIVIISNGEEIGRAIGALPPKQLRDKIVTALSSEH